MGVLQRDPMSKLCFVKVLTSCKDILQIVRIFCHDLTDRSCPRLTPLLSYWLLAIVKLHWIVLACMYDITCIAHTEMEV